MLFVHVCPVIVPRCALKRTTRETATILHRALLPILISRQILHLYLAGVAEMMLKLLETAVFCPDKESTLLQHLDHVNGRDFLEVVFDCFMVLAKSAKVSKNSRFRADSLRLRDDPSEPLLFMIMENLAPFSAEISPPS